MATIYSLICFGGRLGKTVTFTDVGDVVNLTRHGLRDGTGVVFSTSGALPTGLTAGTTYYSREGADSGKFTLHTTASDAVAGTGQVTFTGIGSGTHTVKGAYFSGLTAGQLLRYGDAGSERIYDGIASCFTTRSAAATTFDPEVWEIGENYIDDRAGSGLTINIVAPLLSIYPINGVGHNGNYDTGYTILGSGTSPSSSIIGMNSRTNLSGFTVKCTGLGGSAVYPAVPLCKIDSMVVIGGGTTGLNSFGIKGIGAYNEYTNNVVTGFKRGFEMYQSQSQQLYANNLAMGNDTGYYTMTTSGYFGSYYNNIAIGNVTANWSVQPTSINGAGSNAGESGDTPWVTAGESSITVATTDFSNYVGNDFRPALSSSPQVDTAVEYYQMITQDLAGNERPNYNNGGAEGYDVGPYEFDHGYGNHPASHTLTLDNVVIGSRVFIRDQSDTTTHYDAIAATSVVVIPITLFGDSRDSWVIKIRKASAAPYYKPYRTQMTATAGASSIYVDQIPN